MKYNSGRFSIEQMREKREKSKSSWNIRAQIKIIFDRNDFGSEDAFKFPYVDFSPIFWILWVAEFRVFLKKSSKTAELDIMSSLPLKIQKKIRSFPGNRRCVDCSTKNPQWASISYGTLFCLECSGRHRALGTFFFFSRRRIRSYTFFNFRCSYIIC